MTRNYRRSRPFRKQKKNKPTIQIVLAMCAAAMFVSWLVSGAAESGAFDKLLFRAALVGKSAINEKLDVAPAMTLSKTILTASNPIAEQNITKDFDKQTLAGSMIKEIPILGIFSEISFDKVFQKEDLSGPDESPKEEDEAELPSGDEYQIKDITLSPTSDSGYLHSQDVYLINSTKFTVDVDALLSSKLPFSYDKNKMQVLIVHTHGTESYSPAGAQTYRESDSTRSLDNSENVIRVGDEMRKILESQGVNVVHDTTIHDYPSYNGSYTRSLKTINEQLEKYPSIQIVLDVHRDAIVNTSKTKYRPVTQYKNMQLAQMMLYMGTSEGGLEHKDWQKNLVFAAKLQNKLNSTIPDIMRPIALKKERYNQHATPGSLIIEVGSDGNSLEQALASAKIFAQAVAEVLKEG